MPGTAERMRPDLICCDTCAYKRETQYAITCLRNISPNDTLHMTRAKGVCCNVEFSGWVPADPTITTGVGGNPAITTGVGGKAVAGTALATLVARVAALEAEVAELREQVSVKPATRHFDFSQNAT